MRSAARLEGQHPLTLAFLDPVLERAYRSHTAESALRWYRIVWALLWWGFAASWFADPMMMGSPENAAVARTLRLAVGVPLLTSVLAFGYAPAAWFDRAWAQVHLFGIGVMLLVPTSSLLWMPEPGLVHNGTASISLISVLLVGLVGSPVRFVNALPAAVLIVAPALALGLHSIVHDDPFAVMLWFSVGAATGVFGAWMNEHRHRQAFAATRRLDEERARSERLLRNVLPAPIAERLKDQAGEIADSFDAVTVLFADIAGFTPLSASMSAEGVVQLLNQVFTRFDELAAQHGVEKMGRHRQHRRADGVARPAREDPRRGVDPSAARRAVRIHRPRAARHQGQGPHADVFSRGSPGRCGRPDHPSLICTDLVSRYSSRPARPSSRPMPLWR